MARAASLGHAARHTACARGGAEEPRSRAARPRISFSCNVPRATPGCESRSSAMTGHLLAQGIGDLPGQYGYCLSLIHISEPTRLGMISYAVFCLKKKKRPVYL